MILETIHQSYRDQFRPCKISEYEEGDHVVKEERSFFVTSSDTLLDDVFDAIDKMIVEAHKLREENIFVVPTNELSPNGHRNIGRRVEVLLLLPLLMVPCLVSLEPDEDSDGGFVLTYSYAYKGVF